MATNLANGKGNALTATTSAAQEVLHAATQGETQLFATVLRIWNEGAVPVKIVKNSTAAGFTIATGMEIPAGEDLYIFGGRNPITSFAYATESGSAAITYSAY